MTTLHQKIRADVERRIRSGALKPGEKIPFEHELMAQYSCSRMTVSKALSALTQDGLIERRRKAGSFVRLPRLDAPVLDIPDIEFEITSRGDAYRFEVMSRSAYTAFRPDEITLAGEGGRVLYICGVHFAADKPLAVEHRLINLAAVPQAETADFSHTSPGHWLLHAVPWTHAENQISAVNALPDATALLKAPKGIACLVVERKTWRESDRITSVRQIFNGDSYRLVAKFDHS